MYSYLIYDHIDVVLLTAFLQIVDNHNDVKRNGLRNDVKRNRLIGYIVPIHHH